MKVATLQLSYQGLSSTKLYNYIRIAHKQGVKLLLLGEYVLCPFFKELQNLSLEMIDELAKLQTKVLKESAKNYNIYIVAPMVIVKKKKPYKVIVKFSPKSTSYYYQQILINYPHWDEESFFANEPAQLKAPLCFNIDGLKCAVIAGFELHFDPIWEKIDEKNIDLVLVASVATFNSFERWKMLLASRAFTHNCFVLRANRIGEYKDSEESWEFYGDSLLCSPDGEIVEHLGNQEELMIAHANHKEVLSAKKTWHFKEILKKRARSLGE